MDLFNQLVGTFRRIEEDGYCEVGNIQYEVKIKTVVVADMSFLWKFCGRGHASGRGSFAGVARYMREHGTWDIRGGVVPAGTRALYMMSTGSKNAATGRYTLRRWKRGS